MLLSGSDNFHYHLHQSVAPFSRPSRWDYSPVLPHQPGCPVQCNDCWNTIYLCRQHMALVRPLSGMSIAYVAILDRCVARKQNLGLRWQRHLPHVQLEMDHFISLHMRSRLLTNTSSGAGVLLRGVARFYNLQTGKPLLQKPPSVFAGIITRVLGDKKRHNHCNWQPGSATLCHTGGSILSDGSGKGCFWSESALLGQYTGTGAGLLVLGLATRLLCSMTTYPDFLSPHCSMKPSWILQVGCKGKSRS